MAGYYGVDRGSASKYFQEIQDKVKELKDSQPTSNVKNLENPPSYLMNRNPWVMSTTEWLEKGQGIIWHCNPSEISWNIRLRQSTSKNAYSTVTHNWPNDNRATHFDEFVLNMSFQSGNLLPYNRSYNGLNAYLESDSSDEFELEREAVAPGLINFYDFLKLVDAPKLTSPDAAGMGGGRTNHVVIKYNSNIFPALTLIGQFDPEGIKFTDTASDPNNVASWSATFIVLDSNPRLSDNTGLTSSNSELLSVYLSNMGSKRG